MIFFNFLLSVVYRFVIGVFVLLFIVVNNKYGLILFVFNLYSVIMLCKEWRVLECIMRE